MAIRLSAGGGCVLRRFTGTRVRQCCVVAQEDPQPYRSARIGSRRSLRGVRCAAAEEKSGGEEQSKRALDNLKLLLGEEAKPKSEDGRQPPAEVKEDSAPAPAATSNDPLERFLTVRYLCRQLTAWPCLKRALRM